MKKTARMKKYKLIICLWLISCAYVIKVKGQGLNIGDTLPDLSLNVSNYKGPEINLAKLKGKLIILDFWSHICLSCIQSFSKIDSLQNEFADQIQIILVNRETKDSTDRFFNRRKKIRKPNVPFISGDSILHRLFPHSGVPYHVWIDKSGIVRYMTSGAYANRNNIKTLLANKFFSAINYKKPKYVPHLFDSTFFSSLVGFSYVSKCITETHLQDKKKVGFKQISLNCVSIAELYQTAYDANGLLRLKRAGRLELDVSDPDKYIKPKDVSKLSSWKSDFCFNYHLLLPSERSADLNSIMRNDLDRYFGLTAKVEEKKVRCLALIRTSNKDKLKSQSDVSENKFYRAAINSVRIDSIRFMKKQPYSTFSTTFSNYIELNFNQPFVDKTGLSGDIDISISGSAIDSININLLKEELRKYDLDLIESMEFIKILILSDRKL